MIFLGAGASKVFSLKTMQDLTDDLVSRMKEKGHTEIIDDILKALKRYRLTPDFENIYTTLEALVNPEEGIRNSGAFAAFLASRKGFENLEGHPEYKDVLADFRNLIYDECSIPRGKVEDNKSVFDKLFRITTESQEQRFLSSKTGASGYVNVHVGDTIVTTNYDMAVELYHRWTNMPLADGFKPTRKEYIKELDFMEYGKQKGSRWLIKLHGSIWQFKQGDRIIQTIASPETLPLNISVGEQMMIYPVGEKPILREPYYSFYSIFKEQPWNVLIAIGYSFRDGPVNTAILERLETRPPPRTKLIVVNPDPEEVIRNLGALPSKIDQKIIRIKEPFGDSESLFKKIYIAIGSSDWNDYKKHMRVRSLDSLYKGIDYKAIDTRHR